MKEMVSAGRLEAVPAACAPRPLLRVVFYWLEHFFQLMISKQMLIQTV